MSRGIRFTVHQASEEVVCPDTPPCKWVHRRLLGGPIYCINGTTMDRDRFRRIASWFARRPESKGLRDALADGWPS